MSKLMFMVCPHDTVKEPDRWYRFEQYLIQRLGLEIQFEISLDFQDFHENLHRAHIVYSNPTDSLNLLASKGFTSIARPEGQYDEAVFVANTELSNPTLEALQGAPIATVQGLIPTSIARHMLHERGITPGDIQYKESWLSVISGVWHKETDFGIVYKDTFDGLSEQGKGMVNVITTSDEKKAFHTIDISPDLEDRKDELLTLLLAMETDAQGQEVLSELGIPRWQPVTPDALATMKRLLETYS